MNYCTRRKLSLALILLSHFQTGKGLKYCGFNATAKANGGGRTLPTFYKKWA